MSKVTASTIQAAAIIAASSTFLSAALVISDARYEQWQELFQKQLNLSTDFKWKSKGWDVVGTGIHSLTFITSGALALSLELQFTDATVGYTFTKATLQVGKGRSQVTTTANSGKDLIDWVKGTIEAVAGPGSTAQEVAKPGQVLRNGVAYDVIIAKTGDIQGDYDRPAYSIAFSSKSGSFYIPKCFWYEEGTSQGTNRGVTEWYLQTAHMGSTGNGGGQSKQGVPSSTNRFVLAYVKAFSASDSDYNHLAIADALISVSGKMTKSDLIKKAS